MGFFIFYIFWLWPSLGTLLGESVLVATPPQLPRSFLAAGSMFLKAPEIPAKNTLIFGCILAPFWFPKLYNFGIIFQSNFNQIFHSFFIDICSLQGPLLGSIFYNCLLDFGIVFASWFHLFLNAILNQFWSYFGYPQTLILLLSPRRRANFRVFGMLQNMSKFNKKCIQNCIPNQWKICSNLLKKWV